MQVNVDLKAANEKAPEKEAYSESGTDSCVHWLSWWAKLPSRLSLAWEYVSFHSKLAPGLWKVSIHQKVVKGNNLKTWTNLSYIEGSVNSDSWERDWLSKSTPPTSVGG